MHRTDISNNSYGLLRIYTYYRVALGSLFLLLYTTDLLDDVPGEFNRSLFLYVTSIYTGLNILILLRLWVSRVEPTTVQIMFFLMIDVMALTTMSYASGGIQSGIAYLLIITTATGAIFLRGQWSFSIAAFAALATLAEGIISNITSKADTADLFSAGALGILFFATVILFHYLTQRIHESTAEAKDQAHLAAKAIDISQQIIARMRTGVIVFDAEQNIQLINVAAEKLLGLDIHTPNLEEANLQTLSDIPVVATHFENWLQFPNRQLKPIVIEDSKSEVRINFAKLSEPTNPGTLVFIEDHRQLAQEAQKLKLGSLGQLTASIAHEIRNPLGAISHAAQLLAEAPDLNPADQRLLDIIVNHTRRVNLIIENTLQLSRRSQSQAEVVNLVEWLPKYIEDYKLTNQQQVRPEIDLEIIQLEEQSILAKIDLNHLRQVLNNLLDNGLRYSFKKTGHYHMELILSTLHSTELACLKIIDDGPGISDEHVDHIFEPFYTTENSGSGLGLYICRELCQLNQAALTYYKNDAQQSCFQINFAHAQQVF